jgi:hypothetical protein
VWLRVSWILTSKKNIIVKGYARLTEVQNLFNYNREHILIPSHQEYLEKSVEALKKKYSRDAALHRADNMRIMADNMMLIKEINELRADLTHMKQSAAEKAARIFGYFNFI